MRLLALVWPELREADADAAPFERMLDALDDLSPRVEAVDVGVALVDVTGLDRCGARTEGRGTGRDAGRAVAPLAVRCGIGDNRWLATLAARLARFERDGAPAAFRTLERDGLRDLPLTLLPADAATRQRLALFGLTTMAQLADLPRSAVGAQFGAVGERLQALARGDDPRPIVPRRRPERVEARRDLRDAARRGRRRGAHPPPPRRRPVRPAPRAAPGPRPRGAGAALRGRARPPWRSPSRSRPSSRTGSRASSSLASRPRRTRSRPAATRRSRGRAAGRIGPSAVRSPGRPRRQAAAGLRGACRALGGAALVAGADPAHRFGPGRLWRANGERPTAALPEHRSRLVDIGATRRYLDHPLVQVETDADGTPVRLRMDGTDHGEVGICNRWRVDDGWWREPVARPATRSSPDPALCTIFLDEIRGTWHLERVFD